MVSSDQVRCVCVFICVCICGKYMGEKGVTTSCFNIPCYSRFCYMLVSVYRLVGRLWYRYPVFVAWDTTTLSVP